MAEAPYLKDRNIQTDILVTDRIVSDAHKGASTLTLVNANLTGSPVFTGTSLSTPSLTAPTLVAGSASPIAAKMGALIYSNFPTAGTPWLQPDGTNTIDLMDQFTLPADTLTAGRALLFNIYGIHTGANTNVCTVGVYIGADAGAYQTTVATGTLAGGFNAIISAVPFTMVLELFVQTAAGLQRAYGTYNGGAVANILPTDTSLTQDFTAAKTVTLTLKNVTTAADASLYGWSVELI